MAKILIIEDDVSLARNIRDWLRFEHHEVEHAETGSDGLDKLKFYEYELVILDLNLPGMDGVDILKEFRTRAGWTPVLILTGRTTLSHKAEGFQAGADDYLTKPFDLQELSLRVTALLRRATRPGAADLQIKDLVLHADRHTVVVNGKDLGLNRKEFNLMEFLVRHPDQVFSAETLLLRVWPSQTDATTEAVLSCISRLRKKLESVGASANITTVPGVGYKLSSKN